MFWVFWDFLGGCRVLLDGLEWFWIYIKNNFWFGFKFEREENKRLFFDNDWVSEISFKEIFFE